MKSPQSTVHGPQPRLLAIALMLLLFAASGTAQQSEKPEPVAREVLCLYDSAQIGGEANLRYSGTWQYAQVILDHLGFVCRYHDVQKPLPSDDRMRAVRGIFYWAQGPKVARPDELCRWLAGQARSGRRLVLFIGEPFADSASGKPVGKAAFSELLAALGMAYEGDLPGLSAVYEIVSRDPEMLDFERKLDPVLPLDARYRSASPANRVHLKVRRPDAAGAEIDLVVTGPRGGMVFEPVAVYVDHRIAQSQWRIHPFRFFEEALGASGMPRPDVTTLDGRRIFFAHVDGDGLENRVLDSEDGRETCGERLDREFLARYPLPVTISVIANDVERSEENVKIARRIFARPNVEAAVHGYAHPLDWRAGTVSYDQIPGYRFDVGRETGGAVELVRRLALPEGGAVEVFQWTGDRNPSEDAIAILDRMNVENLNIEEVFFDEAHPSYSFVKPAYLQVGDRVQYGARASSENLYTNLWTRRFWAFRNVLETYRRTGSPVRICPINVYHHFYVVESRTPREVLHEIYRWALEQPIHAVTAGEYVRVLKGFRSAKIGRTRDGGWSVSDYGACRTVRFDREDRNVDLAASRGVTGFKREQGSLYVHLDGRPARIALTRSAPSRAYLEDASGEAAISLAEGRIELTVNSRGPMAWSVAGVPEGSRWGVSWSTSEGRMETEGIEARGGRLTLQLPLPGRATFLMKRR